MSGKVIDICEKLAKNALNVVPVLPSPEQCDEIPDTVQNQNREGQGPPVGSIAYFCKCGECAFYITPQAVRCYYCHDAKIF